MSSDEQKYWYNSSTGEVEFGLLSPSIDRVGPFDTEAEAANAPQKLRERSAAWAEEEAIDNDWRKATGGDGE